MDTDIEKFRGESALTWEFKAQDFHRECSDYLKARSVTIDWHDGADEAEKLEVAKRQYLVDNIAHLKCLAHFVAETSLDHIALRTEIVCKLKLSEMWHQPWKDLVSMALPADGDLSPSILAGVTPLRLSRSEKTMSATVLARTMMDTLRRHELMVVRECWKTVYELSLLALLSDSETKRYFPQRLRSDAADIIRKSRSQFPHLGWTIILDSYFPTKWSA